MASFPDLKNPQRPLSAYFNNFLKWVTNNRYTFNFIAVLLFLAFLPLVAEDSFTQFIVAILIIVVLFFSLHAISANRLHLVIGIFLAICLIFLNFLYFLTQVLHYHQNSIMVALFFFGFVAIVIFSGIIRGQETTRDTIFGAISVYFLIGITWAFGIMTMENLSPHSFSLGGTGADSIRSLSDYVGYSFSVLTTTGNYPVIALTSTARMMMMFEMITGTLFIAVLISWLVGKLLIKN